MTNTKESNACLIAATVVALGMPVAAVHAQTPLPYQSEGTHLGVGSCAGSTCHGSTIARESNVEQNEYLVWSDDEYPDKHASAYEVLFDERSERIARNLGLDAAHEAKICLDCHTDFVPEDRRGE